MINSSRILLATVLGVTMASYGMFSAAQNQTRTKKDESARPDKNGRSGRTNNSENEGERVFAEHCSRCHNAPESLSPRITGTVVRHMRVRANLTAEEERVLLHFFNP